MVDLDGLQTEVVEHQRFLLDLLRDEAKSLKARIEASDGAHAAYRLLDLDLAVPMQFSTEEADAIGSEVR